MELILRPWVATCTETQEHLSEELEGELRGRTARRVRRHLRICPHCREALISLRHAVEGLRALGRADTSPDPDPTSVAGPVVDRIRRGDP
jgi:predicted anti-sigma-YlaC factor YlaD